MNSFVAALMRFGIGRLAAILGIGAGVAAVLVAVTMGYGEPKGLLYSNLDIKEAGSITAATASTRAQPTGPRSAAAVIPGGGP